MNDVLCGLVGDASSTYVKNNNKGMRQAILLLIEGICFYVQKPGI